MTILLEYIKLVQPAFGQALERIHWSALRVSEALKTNSLQSSIIGPPEQEFYGE